MWAALYDDPNWREQWCEGVLVDAPGWMSWEIASIEGKLHFYLRALAGSRLSLESILYNHYPELEITEVPDYTKQVPQNIPNQEWNTYGEDFILAKKPEVYPIRTYEKFFEPQGEKISAEEKRIDPLSSLLEMMAKLGPGEQYWLQITIMSVSYKQEPQFKKEADAEISKLSKRPVKHIPSFTEQIMQMVWHLIYGPQKEGSGEKATYKWMDSKKTEESADKELLLTPGEREILTELENKIKRPIFRTSIRGMYVARRDQFNSGHRQLTRAYFSHFSASHLNSIRFSKVTRPKTTYLFRESIPFIRARRMFRNYILRFPPLFPNRRGECSIFNSEELATLYHFPLKISGSVSPTLGRVESKKGGPPPNLPM
jgi:hypothetical protein